MPDLEPESESEPEPEPEPLIASKALVCSQKRARPSSTTTDSDSNFPDLYGFILVKQYQSKAKQPGKISQGTQDIRTALALASWPSSHKQAESAPV